MKMKRRTTIIKRLRPIGLLAVWCALPVGAQEAEEGAQINIGGSVYGGGSQAAVEGSSIVNLNGGADCKVVIGSVYGGGNNATVQTATTINLDGSGVEVTRMFGGNNTADMDIQPTWNLKKGNVTWLYGGGNLGRMTHPNGLLIDIRKGSEVNVGNLFGGCRKADVRPLSGGAEVAAIPAYTVNHTEDAAGNADSYTYTFPAGKATHVLVRGGNVTNVYGGNDVSGDVCGGNSVAIFHDILGNVYGGGNGGYPYTDNAEIADNADYGDYYYETPAGKTSLEAMNAFRPNAESVYVELGGTESDETVVRGSVFLGGSSAAVKSDNAAASVELKIGSYVTADKVFLGNDGAEMVNEEILQTFTKTDITEDNSKYASFDLTNSGQFAAYMSGVAMELRPVVTFTDDYVDYSSRIGSLYCGGNVGSMAYAGANTLNFDGKIYIYDKLVGGCNTARVAATGVNAAYDGGIIGTTAEQADYTQNGKMKDRLILNVNGLRLKPMKWEDGALVANVTGTGDDARLHGGNIYGGCYTSGHVNGNVVINLLDNTVNKADVCVSGGETPGTTSGKVNIEAQRDDVLGVALSVFGAGYGEDTEVWGSTTINLEKGYTFQIFGGGEEGAVGKKEDGDYAYDAKYSTTVNLCGTVAGAADADDTNATMAKAEYIYGGGFEGLIAGNTTVNLGNGRLCGAFGGSCAADILGYAETYVGRNRSDDSDRGFPWMENSIYGANDLGGKIMREGDFASRVKLATSTSGMLYSDALTTASAYVEYVQGHMVNIFGGCYGGYDYADEDFDEYADNQPKAETAFVNFIPNVNGNNTAEFVYGAGEGYETQTTYSTDKDKMQDRSYVLVDIESTGTDDRFADMAVFGGGMNCGVGMGVTVGDAQTNANSVTAAAVVDLARGRIKAAYGGSYQEGVTRRTIVNVPEGSTVKADRVFAGAYGKVGGLQPCDVYEGTLNYNSDDAEVTVVYGGNNNSRRTIYGRVNVSSPVWKDKSNGELATVYGAGKGSITLSEYTEVNLNNGARVDEVYGGGELGRVANVPTVDALYGNKATVGFGDYADLRGFDQPLVVARDGQKYNTNVLINNGATVVNYAYGGGLGSGSGTDGDVCGTTYVALLGGTVMKDIYGGGVSGGVLDYSGNLDFTASANVYVGGGSVRNVYGGGWLGAVGNHTGTFRQSVSGDIPGETNVVIGKVGGGTFADGVPVVQRNAYGGGEGAPVWGTTHITLNNGYIGYEYNGGDYEEKIDDETYIVGNEHVENERLKEAGNIFGGGYVDDSSVDISHVEMYGGTVRGSVYGGGECAAVGRGTNQASAGGEASPVNTIGDVRVFKAGEAHLEIYGGQVLRNVFGGGRGFNNLGQKGTFGTDGYVFGSTDVRIRGGEIGTQRGLADGYGNVFGGGDIGFVYSGTGTKGGDGYYYQSGTMTEDCKVVIEPMAKAESSVSVGGTSYDEGDYVPVADLDKLGRNATEWNSLDNTGINIHNAVFAGGNVSVGSDQLAANTVTVYGNATAAVRDIYGFDLVSIGGEHIGGLYGDGNLTLVDGYRELNITNYGTDYYRLEGAIAQSQYNGLSDRERAFYKLIYVCQLTCHDKDNVEYLQGDQLTAEEFRELFAGTGLINADGTPNSEYWAEPATRTKYKGRLLNTIQRADFVGMYGSRVVMYGARDRVPSKADYTNYTINRVGEVSLNKQVKPAENTDDTQEATHGNYFGIYNVVNFLGNLTSDVKLTDIRTTEEGNNNHPANGTTTYYAYKETYYDKSYRNIATSQNEVALASGVYLEITRETPEDATEKEWGYITGVVQLDLIDVMAGVGGGYVYAKNQHGTPSRSASGNVTLSEYNAYAASYKQYTYSTSALQPFETSGNFVHGVNVIVDDCYPQINSYEGAGASPAHYWYIKGEIYVYDEYISPYTGVAGVYSDAVNLPLAISAASRGKIRLTEVHSNYYATQTVVEDAITYQPGDAIDWWSYEHLSSNSQKSKFAKNIYTVVVDCTIGGNPYERGTVLTVEAYETLKAQNPRVVVEGMSSATLDYVVREANNLSHDNGYVLTNGFNNPAVWDYTDNPSPSFTATASGVFGQRKYEQGEIISRTLYDDYEDNVKANIDADEEVNGAQAVMQPAYVVTSEITVTNINGTTQRLFRGMPVVQADYSSDVWSSIQKAAAKVVTGTLEIPGKRTVFVGELLTDADITELKSGLDADMQTAIDNVISPAYYCTTGGNYGGKFYDASNSGGYYALDSWCAVSADERGNFAFNFDALNVLLDTDNDINMSVYDAENVEKYSVWQPIDYEAKYEATDNLTYTDQNNVSHTVNSGAVLSRTEFEEIPNEQIHYTAVKAETAGTYYIAKEAFTVGDHNYSAGQMINATDYERVDPDLRYHFEAKVFGTGGLATGQNYYYCREEYKVGERGAANPSMTDINGNSYSDGNTVSMGTIISQTVYENNVVNLQKKYFKVYGNSPRENSSLYVPRESDIYDLTKEKIITVVYEYDYQQSDDDIAHITPLSEKHIVNIHINFKSGTPEIGNLTPPSVVLPGTTVGIQLPTVTSGAFEVTSSGWEIYSSEDDAKRHQNGQPYHNNSDLLYWYQNGYWVAYYAQTYQGKTYSEPVQFTVANYHDLKALMEDKDYHYYIDHEDAQKERHPKIYINDYSDSNENGLDILKSLYDLSVLSSAAAEGTPLEGHALLDERVKGCADLDIILRTNIDHSDAWTPIGTASQCFAGNLHGDGYTVSGLDHSLFGNLCGNVYNLGVTGSFTEAGVANTGDGYVENCWVKTTGTPAGGVKAVFGNPTRTSGYQVVNCYYPASNAYSETVHARGNATKMPDKAFYNGTVTYNLNGFYLNKRYYDNFASKGTQRYEYYEDGDNNELTTKTSYYPQTGDNMYDAQYGDIGYVEGRYGNEDFIYADGKIPDGGNVRSKNGVYRPIWPDDYLFFGQMLTYGYVAARQHEDLPSYIRRDEAQGRLLSGAVAANNNRVYRAPAYFRNGTMGVAHFNPNVVLAKSKMGNPATLAYENMTAIDFTGGNNDVAGGYKRGLNDGKFYAPLLDDSGITGFRNVDLTRNLLVYTGQTAPANAVTHALISSTLPDVAYTETNPTYRTVAQADASGISGHQVERVVRNNAVVYTTTKDHLLVDGQDFNAPIAYTMGDGKRVWYQRTPENFVDLEKGWEGISLPFTAELVTTNEKGEITHFYNNDRTGHEYWLREFKGITDDPSDESVKVASMTYPQGSGADKTATNTFLWDYYYSENTQQDANADTYQTYYMESRTYGNYVYLANGTPYIIGLPGKTYYEFDLSGQFVARNTAPTAPAQLGSQIVTFASKTGASVGVSDNETAGVTYGGYIFRPSYLNESFEAGAAYVLNGAGSSYEVTAGGTTTTAAFRPYFRPVSPSPARRMAQSIVFSNESSEMHGHDIGRDADNAAGGLSIVGKRNKIVVTSALAAETQVRIVTISGAPLTTFSIKPGETIETDVHADGIYIVQAADGRYTKKLAIK